MAETQLVGVWDADIIVPAEQIRITYQAMLDDAITLAYPFDGRFVCLSERQTQGYLSKEITLDAIPPRSILGRPSYGGAFIVNRENIFTVEERMSASLDGGQRMPNAYTDA